MKKSSSYKTKGKSSSVSRNRKEAVNQKILKIIEKREQIENKIIETQEEEMNTEE